MLDRLESKLDPATHCQPPGVPRMGAPHQIVQGPGIVVFLYDSPDASYDAFRLIPTDGRKHRAPEEINGSSPSYNGDSIGRWEGDTLVVIRSTSMAMSGSASTDGSRAPRCT